MASWLADLAALRGGPGEAAPMSEPDFQVAYMAELNRLGINVLHLDATINALFAGHDDLYNALVKRLDSFPPGQRMAAYLRSAEAVMHYGRLRQYVVVSGRRGDCHNRSPWIRQHPMAATIR
jgi:hypothetical protein